MAPSVVDAVHSETVRSLLAASAPASANVRLDREDVDVRLHDSLGRTLLLLQRRLDVLLAGDVTPKQRTELCGIRRLTSATLDKLRDATATLELLRLGRAPTDRALRLLAADLRRTGDASVEVRVRGPVGELSPRLRDVLVPAARDVLLDLRSHALATVVLITLAVRPTEVVLEIADDGVDVTQASGLDWRRRSPELVLAGIARAAATVGGRLLVLRARPRGLRLSIRIPLDEAMDR